MTILHSKNPVQRKNGQHVNELWSRYSQTRGEKERELLLTQYAYLVRYVLGRMKVSLVPYLDRDDLESAGTISLIQAIDKFDPGRGVKFETFAYQRIQGGILDYLRDLDYLSRTSRDRIKKFKRAFEHLKEKLGRAPFDDELMNEMEIDSVTLKKIYFGLSCDPPISLEGKNGQEENGGEEMSGSDEWADPKEVEALDQLVKKETVSSLAKIIDKLPEKEKLLISLYYFDELTFKEIGEILNVSESRVCQMHGKALVEMESAFRDYR